MSQPLPDVPFQRQATSRAASLRILADLSGRGCMFLLVVAAQRMLGPADYGHVTFALAAGLVLATITDLGLPLIVTRQVARRRSDAARIVGTSLTLKSLLVLPAAAALIVAAFFRPDGSRLPFLALGAGAMAMSFVEFIGYVLRGLDRVHQEAVLLLALRVTTLVVGGWALWSGYGLSGFAVAYLTSTLGALALGTAWLVRRHVVPDVGIDPPTRRELLRQALPLAGATVLSVGYLRTGVFMLDIVRGPAAVGQFGVAQKLTEPLALVPAAVLATTFPSISRSDAPTRSRSARAWTVRTLTAAGLTIAVAGALLAPQIIGLLYGSQYQPAVRPLQILAMAVLPVYVNFALTHLLIADGRTHLNLLFNAVVFALNLILCLRLAGPLGPSGVAVAIVVSEAVLFALCAFAVWRVRPRAHGERS